MRLSRRALCRPFVMLSQPPVNPVFQQRQALVYHLAVQKIFLQHTCRPLPEPDAQDGIHPISNRDDCVKIVEADLTGDFAPPFYLNYRGFLGSCLLIQLPARIYVLKMQSDIVSRTTKQSCHLALRQPHGLVFKTHVQTDGLVRLVHDNLVFACAHLTLLSIPWGIADYVAYVALQYIAYLRKRRCRNRLPFGKLRECTGRHAGRAPKFRP